MKKTKKVVKRKLKNTRRTKGREPSNKNKDSKVRKLIRLAKTRTKKGEKSSSKGLGHFLRHLHKRLK